MPMNATCQVPPLNAPPWPPMPRLLYLGSKSLFSIQTLSIPLKVSVLSNAIQALEKPHWLATPKPRHTLSEATFQQVCFSLVICLLRLEICFVRAWFLYSSFSGNEKAIYIAVPRMKGRCSYDALGLGGCSLR